MRNVFDQYGQPENRLTHALLSCLDADRQLLQRFVLWATGLRLRKHQAEILEQSLPGDPPDVSDEEAEKRGLPDGCIFDQDGWALLIESKFQAPVSEKQIKRHLRTAARRGLTDPRVLILSVAPYRRELGPSVFFKRWTEVYEWLSGQAAKSSWAGTCAGYMEAAEAREAANGYLKKGTLTVFTGIPFGVDEPYSYLQAKRLLGLLRDELRASRKLEAKLGMDGTSKGRGAITGRDGRQVWDFIGLKQARNAKQFTQYPHLTLGIRDDRCEAYVTVPNGIRSRYRTRMLGPEYGDFEQLIGRVTKSLMRVVRAVPGSAPTVVVVQRHFKSQRSQGILDCALRFDPRTVIALPLRDQGHVKLQPHWLRATYDALQSRRSNLQFQIGMDFPYNTCPTSRSRKIIKACADTWLACRPIIEAIRED